MKAQNSLPPLVPNPGLRPRAWFRFFQRVSVGLLLLGVITLACGAENSFGPSSTQVAAADLAVVHQTLDNFSASGAWSMQNVGVWSEPNRTLVADLLFNRQNGIGLSAWRFHVAAGFDSRVQRGNKWHTWRTEHGFLTTEGYDWTQHEGQRWFLAAAKARGVAQFIAMVYSPPTNYTRNGHVFGADGNGSSNLKPGHEEIYSQFLGDVLAHFATNPVTPERVVFDYIMPFNEPAYEWNDPTQEGCRYANDDIIALTRQLRAALDVRGLKTEIVLPEAPSLTSLYKPERNISRKYGKTYGDYLSAFDSITNIISRNISAHSYFTDDPATQLLPVRQTLKAELDKRPFWRFWQSEYCVLGSRGPKRDLSMATALDIARVMWTDITVAHATAWHWWLSISPADYKDGLLYTDWWKPGDAETIYCSKSFWVFGHWSRFIRPGWKRVDLPGCTNIFGLMGAAFVSPATDSLAIVLVNPSATNQMVTPAAVHLPAGKAIAYWNPWITSPAPADNLSPLPPVAPGEACLVPAHSVMTFTADLVEVAKTAAPQLSSIPDQTVAAGQTLILIPEITDPDTPASLVSLKAYADKPELATVVSRSAPTKMGGLTHDSYKGFAARTIESLAVTPAFPHAPSQTGQATAFQVPGLSQPGADRLRGFIIPPVDGAYVFSISGPNPSELYLSHSENPAAKTRIAGGTGSEANATPQSNPVMLKAGRRYYVEAVQAGDAAQEGFTVSWRLPNGVSEAPIPALRLAPWTDGRFSPLQKTLSIRTSSGRPVSGTVCIVATDTLGNCTTNRFTVSTR